MAKHETRNTRRKPSQAESTQEERSGVEVEVMNCERTAAAGRCMMSMNRRPQQTGEAKAEEGRNRPSDR